MRKKSSPLYILLAFLLIAASCATSMFPAFAEDANITVISGTVLTPDGNPFIIGPGDWCKVQLEKPGGEYVSGCGTDDLGQFRMETYITSGDYVIKVFTGGSGNPYVTPQPVNISVTEGVDVNCDISLLKVIIKGRILTPEGEVFIPGDNSWAYITLTDQQNGKNIAGNGIEGDGSFKLGGDIPAGSYLLNASADGDNNPYANSASLQVNIVDNQVAEHDIALTQPLITGYVLTPEGNPFIRSDTAGAKVHLESPDGQFIAYSGLDNNSRFKFGGGISEGNYVLRALTWGSGNPYTGSAVEIYVADQPVAQNIALTVPILMGKVYTPEGDVFQRGDGKWCNIMLVDANNVKNVIGWADVEDDGTYRLGGEIPTGSYFLDIGCGGVNNPYAKPGFIPIELVAGQTSTFDITLTNPVVKGTVLTPDGGTFKQSQDSWAHVYLTSVTDNAYITGNGIEEDGSFKLGGGIPAGEYWLNANADGSSNPYSNAVPILVHINEGSTLYQDISFTIPTIEGYVYAPDGSIFKPYEGSWANIFLTRKSDGQWVGGTGVNGDGMFKFGTEIPAGDYFLNANTDGDDNPYSGVAPIAVHITEGSTIYQDISLTNPKVKGFVYKPDGSAFTPSEECWVNIFLTRASDDQWVDGAGIRSDGSFKLGGAVPDGDYLLHANADGAKNPYANSPPIPVSLTGGQLREVNITLGTPAVYGKVLTPEGNPFASTDDCWFKISIMDSWGKWLPNPQQYADGTYKIGRDFPPGDYTIYVDCGGSNNPYANALPTTVKIQDGITQEINLMLTIPSVQGFVYKPDGTLFIPSEENGVYLSLSRASDGYLISGTGVNSDGSFKLGGIAEEGDYILYARANGSYNELTDSGPIPLHLKPGETINQPVSLTNPTITGLVLNPDGTVFESTNKTWARVEIEKAGDKPFAMTYVEAGGRYKFGEIFSPGEYILRAYTGGEGNPYANSTPLKITVAEDQQSQLRQNLSLTYPIITGKILKPDGSPLEMKDELWVNVVLRDQTNVDICRVDMERDGSYRIGGLIPPGTYRLCAYPNGRDNVYSESLPIKISIVEGQTADQDIRLTVPAVLGRVLDHDGTPLRLRNGIWAEIRLLDPADTSKWFGTGTDGDGFYRLGGNIPPGNYLVIALPGGDGNPYLASSPVRLNITPGAGVVQDFRFGRPLISGKVYTPEGNVLTEGMGTQVNISVRSASQIKDILAWTELKKDGSYLIAGDLADGDYVLYPEVYSGTGELASPGPIPVHIGGGVITNADITLVYNQKGPRMEAIGFKTVEAGELLEFTVNAFDKEGAILTYSAINLPQGASFDPASRTFSWTPEESQAGVYYGIRFEASDGRKADFEVIRITVTSETVTPPTDPIPSTQEEFTTDEDFDKGVLTGVEHETIPDQLQLSKNVSTLPFIWIPNSDGTISKLNTETGAELGRYRVSPDLPGIGDPSRTTVDLDGNCWVGNRRAGTVVKIGLLENGQWADRNGDGICQTSRDIDGNGYITPDEVLPWGEDECVLYEIVLVKDHEGTYVPGTYEGPYDTDYWGAAPRGLAIDADNNVWVGTFSTQMYYQIDGTTGEIIERIDVSPWGHNAYGAVIDENGVLWSVDSQMNSHILRIEPNNGRIDMVETPYGVYGIGLDYNGHLFYTSMGANVLGRVNIVTGETDWVKKCEGINAPRGVVCTRDNKVFVANSGGNSVTVYTTEGDYIAEIPVGLSPSGVAVDSSGKVWACDIGDEKIHRIDPVSYSIEFSKAILGGGGHYTYSDMTGILSHSITTTTGSWSVIRDSGDSNTSWGIVSWTSDEPEGTSVEVYARSSNDLENWSPMVPVENGLEIEDLPDGRYIMIDSVLKIESGDASPVLKDIKIVSVQKAKPTEITAFDASCEYSDTAVLSAVLKSEGVPVAGKLLEFKVNGAYVGSALTGNDGKASIDYTVNLPAGSYVINVSFPQDYADRLLTSEETAILSVTPEKAQIRYTGQLAAQYPGEMTLAAKVTQENDGSPGDLKLARVLFEVSAINGDGTTEPAGKYIGACNSSGEASVSVPIGVGVYIITASIIEEGWFTPEKDTVTAPVYEPSKGFTTGGGWISTADSERANFGFNAKYHQGVCSGNLEYQCKDAGIDLKGKEIDWLVVSKNIAQFQGTGTIKGLDGIYTFRVMVIDNKDLRLPDKITITIWAGTDTDSEPVYEAVNQDLQGGNIQVKAK